MAKRGRKPNGTANVVGGETIGNDDTASGSSDTSAADSGDNTARVNLADVGGNTDTADGDDNRTELPRRGRGRPRGSTNTSKPLPLDINGIERLLIGVHTSLAALASAPEWLLDDNEAKQVSIAVANVASHYKIKGLDRKTQDWLLLIQVVGLTYGTRAWLTRQRIMEARKNTAPSSKPQAPLRNQPAAPGPTVQVAPAQSVKEPIYTPPAPRPPARDPLPQDVRTATIPGAGAITFPPDHPLVKTN